MTCALPLHTRLGIFRTERSTRNAAKTSFFPFKVSEETEGPKDNRKARNPKKQSRNAQKYTKKERKKRDIKERQK